MSAGAGDGMTASERLARLFHETYERLAPSYGYKTRLASAVPWEEVPEDNRRLMIAVATKILGKGYVRTWADERDSDVDFPPEPDVVLEDPLGFHWANVDEDGWAFAGREDAMIYTWSAVLGQVRSLREVIS